MLIFTQNKNGEPVIKYIPKTEDFRYPNIDKIKDFVIKRKEKGGKRNDFKSFN